MRCGARRAVHTWWMLCFPTCSVAGGGHKSFTDACDGRMKGTKMILGSNYKVPIVVEERNEIIFFPTESPNSPNCIWFSLNNVEKYERSDCYTKVTFTSGRELIVKMSLSSFENQILRANRLGSMIRKRSEG